jgi:hypothetical protein
MGTRTIHRRLAPGLLAAGMLLAPLTACGGTVDQTEPDAAPEVTATESTPAEGTDEPTGTSTPEDTAGATGAGGSPSADVDCSGTSCTVTLSGSGAETEVLGTPVSLGAVEGGQATVRVGDQEVSCSQGESVSAGPLTLECTVVAQDSVTMTASLG